MIKLGFLILLLSLTASVDDFPTPGGVYGGHYLMWGQPPFVERETIPLPRGALKSYCFQNS